MTGTSLDREKLDRVLGSAHDGEIAAAGRTADRLVREAGLRWPDVVLPALPPPWRTPPPPALGGVNHEIAFLLDNLELLTEWELEFITSISRQRRKRPNSGLSDKQLAIIERLFNKACQPRRGGSV